MLTTAKPATDITQQFDWLAEFAASAIRLHPRRARNLPVHVSKMGGLFLWPRDVPWPVCRARREHDPVDWGRPERLEDLSRVMSLAYELAQFTGFQAAQREPARQWLSRQLEGATKESQPPRDACYLPLLQLRRAEFAELPWPRHADLMQLLWCPHVHFAGEPGFLLFWRRQDDVQDPLLQEPDWSAADVELHECRLHPEYITEYPQSPSFEPHFREDLDRLLNSLTLREAASPLHWRLSGSEFYDESLAAAPGVKLFGYPRWIQEPCTPVCECGRRMSLLVTVDSHEAGANGETAGRWRPVEEASAETPPAPHGFTVGDPGALFLFHCPVCPGLPLRAVVQTA
ncbi:MAG: hypothetical protein IT162_16990 [Bryobacterales bacterium]|nr:hypothetical protein [Bryobacterales bacterium]